MKAAVLREIKDIQIEDVENPVIQADEALVKIKAVGVCGSDVHYYLHGRIGNQVVKGPHILGHEVSAEVVEVGKNVKNISPGTRVAVEPGIPCRQCEPCKRGRYNICPDVRFLGTPPVNGAYCEYLAWPADFLYSVPDSVSFAEASLIETMAVGMHAVELADLKIGDDVAILGCGPIGLVTLKAVKAAGAKCVFAIDLIDKRLEFARKHNNVVAINASREDPVETIRELTNGRGVDIVFEAAGALKTFRQSVEIARIGGKVIWIGIPPEDYISIEAYTARNKELVIKLIRRFKHNFKRCIEAVESGDIVLKDMITHEFKLKDIVQAFELVENYRDGVMKAVINL